MRKTMNSLMTAVTLLAFLTVSCGSGYRPPLLAPATFSYQIAGTKDRLFDKAINALSQLDFEVVIQDRVGGQIRTMPKQMNLQPSECDCGAYYTKEFIKDPLTTVSVEVVIDIQDGMLKFATRMSGAHKNSFGKVDRNLDCISSGEYEKYLAEFVAGRAIP